MARQERNNKSEGCSLQAWIVKLSAFTCITKPDERQDPWRQSIESALSWADEVVIVDGLPLDIYEKNKKVFPQAKWIHYPWSDTWDWGELPPHYNRGLEACTGDWAIRFDADYVFSDQ